jgi:AcrR family transcriptional regulator
MTAGAAPAGRLPVHPVRPVTAPVFPSQRQRAIDPQEKAARRESILDAAARLYDRAQLLPGVAEVAAAAGLAKGTMYLYFETKEAIYLGLHQRHTRRFFEALIERLDGPQPFDVEVMLAIVDEHMIRPASVLPLGHVCMGAAPDRIDEPTLEAFHRQLGEWLARAGGALERRLPRLLPGDGMRFLHHGYALMLGLYQLLGQASQCAVHARLRARGSTPCGRTLMPAIPAGGEFRVEAHAALRGLWQLALSHGLPPALPVVGYDRSEARD